MDYKTLGMKIKKARIDKSLTQEQLAEICCVSAPYIGIIERADKIPSIDTLVKLSSALDISLDYLLSESLNLSSEIRAHEIISSLKGLNTVEIDTIIKVVTDISSHFRK